MQDEDIIQFMECRGKPYTLEELKDYIKRMDNVHNGFLIGIYTNGDNEHIGNIKIEEIDQLHKFGTVICENNTGRSRAFIKAGYN
jgi:hypothetical protein